MNQVIHPFQVDPLPSTTTSSRRKRSAEPQRRVCSLALVADHIFHKEVGGGDIASTVLQMLYHVREANAVFLTKVGQVALWTFTSHVSGFSQQQQERLHRVPGDQGVLLIWKNILKTNKVEAITILETEKSYVNILLGDYDVPEVQILSRDISAFGNFGKWTVLRISSGSSHAITLPSIVLVFSSPTGSSRFWPPLGFNYDIMIFMECRTWCLACHGGATLDPEVSEALVSSEQGRIVLEMWWFRDSFQIPGRRQDLQLQRPLHQHAQSPAEQDTTAHGHSQSGLSWKCVTFGPRFTSWCTLLEPSTTLRKERTARQRTSRQTAGSWCPSIQTTVGSTTTKFSPLAQR